MPDQPHILVVDDDRRIRELLQSYLRDHGFRVTVAASAQEARARLAGLTYDVAILDVMMPGESGLKLTEALRSQYPGMPVLLLSALSDAEDRIKGLSAGSDDYLPKPFEPRELLLRIGNLLRRSETQRTLVTEVSFGDFLFQIARGELRKAGELIRLSPREKDMLRRLAQHPGQPVDRGDLAGPGSDNSTRGVDVHITRLRQKIEDDPANPVYLQTVRGSGYILHIDGST